MIINMLKSAAGMQTSVTNENGAEFVSVSGYGTFPIKDQLSQLGFRWDATNKRWRMMLRQLLANPSALSRLQTMGVDTSSLGGTTTAPTVAPKQPQNWLSRSGVVWYLATVKEHFGKPGTPIALSRGQNGAWNYVMPNSDPYSQNQWDEDVYMGDVEIQNLVVSVKDGAGNKLSGADPKSLILANFPDALKKTPAATQPKEQGPKGRIPPDKISPEQKEIETSFLNSQSSIMTNALAGSGKTTMLRHLSSFMKPGEKWLYLVFNKKNQTEGREKFPKGIEVLTSHAFLGRVLGRSAELGLTEQTEIWNQGERISQILDHSMDHDNTFPRPLKYAAKKIIKQLASLGKAYAIIPNAGDAAAQLQQIIRQYQIDCDLSTDKFRTEVDYTAQLIDKALDLMHSCLPGKIGVPQFQNFRDHDDTLWYAAIMNEQIKWPKYDVVLADEVQDFNRCQVIMLQKLAQAGARIIAVGDPNQAIYLFRGADANAFNNIGGMMEGLPSGAASHTLPTNYRSGKAIIDFVNENTKVKNLRAGMQHEGLVTANIMYDDAIGNLSTEWRQGKKFSQPTAFIARTNKPLVTAALDLMRNDMDFVLIGRDFSQELVSHLRKVLGEGRNQRSVPITSLADELIGYAGAVEERWAGKISKAPELKQIKETTESLVEVIGYLQSNNFQDPRVNMRVRDSAMFIEYLRSRFGGVNTDTAEGAAQLSQRDPRSYVTICTAHRSKGLEFDRVFILKNELFPHPNAKTPEALDQEENAKYVAYTRAMNELHILIHPAEPQQSQENQRR